MGYNFWWTLDFKMGVIQTGSDHVVLISYTITA